MKKKFKNKEKYVMLTTFGFTLAELIGVVIILALIALLAFPPILNSIRKTKGELSDASKEILYNATDLYISKNLNDFPKTNGNTYCITLNTLVAGEYLPTKVYDSTTGEEISLDSKVEVKVKNDSYTYNMNNECVEQIHSAPNLIAKLLSKYNQDNTTGLIRDYKNTDIYYYTGNNNQVYNNYLWYGGHQWRIIEFNVSEKTLTLISQQPLTAIRPIDEIWTTSETYKSTHVNNWLNDYFYNSLYDDVKNNILLTTFNIGSYSGVTNITVDNKVGLLDKNQYMRAGGADSYLDIEEDWYYGNYGSGGIMMINDSGAYNYYDNINSSWNRGIRPVIKIFDLYVNSGDGTLSSSYNATPKSININTVQVGEYINIPYKGTDNACGSDNICTFRVVSKDEDSVKITLNGLLNKTSAFGDTSIFSQDSAVYSVLENFYNNLDQTYLYSLEKKFYIGDYLDSELIATSYTDIFDETFNSKFGLPMIGEMFGGNDIDISTSSNKIFVDANTIENPSITDRSWLMNRKSDTMVFGVHDNVQYTNASISLIYGIRPTLFLKKGLNFNGGEGTAQNPYTY